MNKLSRQSLGLVLAAFACLAGCGGGGAPQDPVAPPVAGLPKDPPLAPISSNVLPNFDAATAQILTNEISNPITNETGDIVWNTRYYMEALLTAYAATGNQKYITSFLSTANTVLGLIQTLTVPDVPDPSAPANSGTSTTIAVTGWPTYLATFGQPVPVLTATGQISFYVQSLFPDTGRGPFQLIITPASSGGVTLSWYQVGTTFPTYSVVTETDLDNIAALPLDYETSFFRIFPTGLGLPAPGTYQLDFPLFTVWHGEQTAGILLPFIRFLLIVKQRPELLDASTASAWTAQIMSLASAYENQLVSDGKGGLVITNPFWMPSTEAGLPAQSDYIHAETTMRMLLYVLTGDTHELALAQGLFKHELTHLPVGATNGWLFLMDWPDIVPWSEKSQAPYGSIWTSLEYYVLNESSASEGTQFVEMIQTAADYGLNTALGIPANIFSGQQLSFSQYMLLPTDGARALTRAGYPFAGVPSDYPITPSPDVFATSGYLAPVNSSNSIICQNWNWMLANGQAAQAGADIGYTLRAWARSEAAVLAQPGGQCPAQ